MFPRELYTFANIERERNRKSTIFPVLEQKTFEGIERKRKKKKKECFLANCMLQRTEREKKYHFSSGCSPNEKLSKERKRDERGKGRKEKERRKRGREGKRRGEGEFLSSRDSGGNRPVTTQISPIRIPGTATREYPQAE